MAIKPICDKCKQEITQFGALLFSPPDAGSRVDKFHLCVNCYAEILKDIKK